MRIRQISNFPIKFLLMLMGAMPFGSISVCKLEADEEEEGVEGGQDRGNLWLSLAGLPGSEATEAASSSWHPPGVCTSIAPGAALTINILNFFKMQKPHRQTPDHWVFQVATFGIFSELCAGGGCRWPQWVEASWADRGQRGEQPRRGCSASPRLVSGLARRHPPAAPNIASSKQPTGPAVDAAWPARNVCIGSPPVACLVYLFTIGCHPGSGPAGLA